MTGTAFPGRLIPGLYAGAFVLLLGMSWLLPLAGPLASVFAPTPLVLLYRRHGPGSGRKGLGLAALLATALVLYAGTPGAFFYFLFYLGVGAALGEARALGLADDKAITLAAAVGAGLVLVLAVYLAGGDGGQILEGWQAQWTVELDAFLAQYQSAGLSDVELSTVRENIVATARVLIKLAPAILAVGCLLTAWVNALLVRVSQRGREPLRPLNRWSAPERLVWLVIASGAAMVLGDGWLFWTGANLLAILGVIYFFQGMAIAAYWLDRKNAPRLLRAAIYVLIVAEMVLAAVVALAGLLDMWFNLRRLGVDKPSGPEALP